MLLTLALPRLTDLMVAAEVTALHVGAGDALLPGAKVMDLRVDLSTVAPHDCPPISHYRVVLREPAYVREFAADVGDEVAVGELLATLTTDAEESPAGEDSRPVRYMIAGIIGETDGW